MSQAELLGDVLAKATQLEMLTEEPILNTPFMMINLMSGRLDRVVPWLEGKIEEAQRKEPKTVNGGDNDE